MNGTDRQSRLMEAFFRAPDEVQRVTFQSLLFFLHENIKAQLIDALEPRDGLLKVATAPCATSAIPVGVELANVALVPQGAPAIGDEGAGAGGPLGNTADLVLMSPPVASVRESLPRRRIYHKVVRTEFPPGSLMTPDEVASYLSISKTALEREMVKCRMPLPCRILRKRRFRLCDVEHYVSSLGSQAKMEPYLRKETQRRFWGHVRGSHLDYEMVALVRSVIEGRFQPFQERKAKLF